MRRWRWAAIAIFGVNLYLIASWSDWQFGASFSHRGFTDGLAVAAIFIAASFAWIAAHGRARVPAAAVTTVLIGLCVFQMLQYWNGILPTANTTWPEYRQLFLRWP